MYARLSSVYVQHGLRPYIKDAQKILSKAHEIGNPRITQQKIDFLHLPIIDGNVTTDSAMNRWETHWHAHTYKCSYRNKHTHPYTTKAFTDAGGHAPTRVNVDLRMHTHALKNAHPHVPFVGLARSVCQVFKYHIYVCICRIMPYSVYTEKMKPLRIKSK